MVPVHMPDAGLPTNLPSMKSIVSVQHNEATYNIMRYACTVPGVFGGNFMTVMSRIQNYNYNTMLPDHGTSVQDLLTFTIPHLGEFCYYSH